MESHFIQVLFHIENSCHNFIFGSCEQNLLLVFKFVVYQFVFDYNKHGDKNKIFSNGHLLRTLNRHILPGNVAVVLEN